MYPNSLLVFRKLRKTGSYESKNWIRDEDTKEMLILKGL
jgi:hypothetical protein